MQGYCVKCRTKREIKGAMTSKRPYRQAMTNRVALAKLERNKGTQFDPEVVAVLGRL
ncbi:MAG: hypothetical protein QGI51_03620 [Dehalococcoidales bacterium]|nr:hypothetical protein [Dehalococcoidales bacterium]